MMTETMETDGDAELVPGRPTRWEHLLCRVVLSVGLEVEPELIRAAASHFAVPEGSWSGRLVRACSELGLHATARRGTVASASHSVGVRHPVVVVDAYGDWVLLTDRRGVRIQAERAGTEQVAWTRRGELAEAIDPEGAGSIEWVAIDPPGWFTEAVVCRPPKPIEVVSPWARLRSLMRQERHDMAVTLLYAIGVGLLTLATPIAVQALVNSVAFGTLLQPLAVLTLLLLLGLTLSAALRSLQAWVVEILQRRLFVRLVHDLAHRLPRVERSAFDQAHGPDLVNRFFDVFTIQKATSSLLLGGLELALAAVVGMVVLAFYHPLLLAFDVVLLAVIVVIVFGMGRGAVKTAVDESKAKYAVASWLEEVARHPTAFKLAGGPELARERADQLAASYIGKRKKHFRVVFRQIVGALALHAFASAGILGIGGWLVIERQLTLGQLVAAELVVTLVVVSLAKIGKHLETVYDLLAAVDKVGQLIDLPLEQVRRAAPGPRAGERGARIAARGVKFGFEGREMLFEDLDLELDAGERVMLNARSGVGRSALADVLIGVRAPIAGAVELDGCDLADLDHRAVRARVALVRGDELVAGTLFENVAFGRDIDARAVREALRAVDLLDEIAALPEGLSTRVVPDGSPLSRGQAARVALARAIAGRPSFLVIDGALDGLDHDTFERVLDVLCREDAPWTLLIVSDHPAVAARCSRTFTLRSPGAEP
jgi:putative ABC transport system ATP-binding protein